MTWCPKCGVQPPRRPWTGRGRVAECVACWRVNRQAHSLAVSRRRSDLRALALGHAIPAVVDEWTRPMEPTDISAAEIEARYQAALAEIRSRARTEAR